MKTTFVIAVLLAVISAGSCSKEVKNQEKLFSKKLVEDKFDMSFSETERGPDYSIARVSYKKGSSVGSSMFIFSGMYKIAKLRKFEYFFKAREWQDENDAWVYKIYLFNDPGIPLKKLLGKDYSKEAQELFDELGYISVKKLELMFGRKQ